MNHWMCSECKYIFAAETPSETCPSCHAKCIFSDVTCYIPECGGPEHLDPKLVARRVMEAKEKGIN